MAGKGGRDRGIPRFPSIDPMSAVSSPHTKAPAPSFIFTSKLKSESRILFPRSPYSLICPIAFLRRSMARGYSALMYMIPLLAPIA